MDFLENYSNSSGSEDSDENLELRFGTVNFESVNRRLNTKNLFCLCKNPEDKDSVLALMNEMLDYDIEGDKYSCILSNIIRCFNIISKDTSIDDPHRLGFCDLFYRLRHEILFKGLMGAINMPPDKSDIPFSQFGINSKRTPDLIMKVNKTLVIIEVSASSNFESAAMMKGLEEYGFESKYQKEIDILIDLGVSYCYLPFIFDMSDPNNEAFLSQLKRAEDYFHVNKQNSILLKILSNLLCDLTCSIKDFLIPSSMLLFSSYIPIEKNHDGLRFLYDTEPKGDRRKIYKEFYVSVPTYRKVYNNWQRIPTFLNRLKRSGSKDNKKYIVLIDIKTSKLNFTEGKQGKTIDEIETIYWRNNKPEFLKNTYLLIGDKMVPSIDSETGVLFRECIDVSGLKRSTNNYPDIKIIANHEGQVYKFDYDLSKYLNIVDKYYSQSYYSNDYDPDYEGKILESYRINDSICLPDINNESYVKTKHSLLSDLRSDSIKINQVVDNLIKDHISLNQCDDVIPLKLTRMKNPFIMPLGDFCSTDYESLDFKNISLLDFIIKEISITNPYTSVILSKVKDIEYSLYDRPKQKSEFLEQMNSEKISYSRQLTKSLRDVVRTFSKEERIKFSKMKAVEYFVGAEKDEIILLQQKISTIDKKIREREVFEGIKREIGLIRLPTKNKKSEMGVRFLKEMEHFKSKEVQSSYKGVGIIQDFNTDHINNNQIFHKLINLMPTYRGENPDLIMDTQVYDDSKMLRDLKQKAIDDYKSLLSEVKNSFLGHSAAFVSRLGHSLMFYSQMPFNSDYVRVDNLGYNCCFLIIRGGKKIFKSKSSKLFRVFYPVNDVLRTWLEGDISRPSSSQLITINDRLFLLSPWMMWNESILTDSLSFYTRTVSFTVLNIGVNFNMKEMFKKVAINVLLAFHNRRQTEVLLANMRYILLSTLGDFTGIQGVLPDFIGFNYDCFQSYIRSSILINYPKYFNSLVNINKTTKQITQSNLKNSKVQNIFTGELITNSDDLTLMIYSTFLMTKAPYQKIAERANNLKGILKIHEQYDNEIGLKLTQQEQYEKLSVVLDENNDFQNYMDKLFSNDFSFDPKYCANLGVFADSYFKNRNLKDKFHTEWLRIMNKSWDTMATSTGLRGDISDKDGSFWGQKGYFVVYKNLANRPEYIEGVKSALCNDDLTDDEKRRLVKALNKMYINEVSDRAEKPLIFHVVDKVQWRGSREIYVMDINTKTLQQPIEQFMGELCKHLENELISIPSDRRAQVIHHTIFEKDLPLKEIMTWYLTLDCTKWAPKSIFVKFAITILNMECIPPSFKTHFLNYLDRLYKKKVYFNSAEVLALKNNQNYKDIVEKYLIKDDDVNGYYMDMPYSWVMGIFNYTSSFMHSINQLYASYLISKSALENLNEDVSLTMFAHSDDSGGRLSCRTKAVAQRCLMLYEVNLKSSNHLISRKKSVISKIYFEVLSIIYLFKRLLALLPKFLGGLRFLPTDKGPAQDLLQSYSKCNEVVVAGANFSMAYIVLKMMSMMIWRFYFNRNPNKKDYERPTQYLGMPDAHPLMVLISGSDSDIIRLITINKENLLKAQMILANKITESIDDAGPIRPFKYNINVKNISKDFKKELTMFSEILNDWSIKNVNFKLTPFNMLNFLSKLSDPGFIGSMTNESTVRRFSRCYYMRSNDSLLTKFGLTSSEKVISSFDKLNIIMDGGSVLKDTIINTHYENESEFWMDLKSNLPTAESQLKVLKNVLAGPLKICSYMDKMSLNNRDFKKVDRTIKPTHIQLYKTGKTFSVDFDPAQLVAYIKDSDFKWALPGIRKIETASQELKNLCAVLGVDIDVIDENTLLRLCRNYSTKNVKDIYIYSQIPSEIRSIKTYSAFLSFIATNSFEGLEIGGLTLSLGTKITDPGYLITQVDENTYTINTILVLLLSMAKEDTYFLRTIKLKPVPEIGWSGGSVSSFLFFVEDLKFTDPDYPLLRLQCRYILKMINFDIDEIGAEATDILNKSSYYTFTKEQKSKSGWRGKGEILIVIDTDHYLFEIYNDRILHLTTDQVGKLNKYRFGFISDTLQQCGVRIDPNSLRIPSTCQTDLVFGYDYSGDISVCPKRECSFGIECLVSPVKNSFLNDMQFSKIIHSKGDIFLMTSEMMGNKKTYRVNCLRPKNSEFATIASNIFREEDFSKKLDSMGLGSLEDFIYSELLIKMGAEAQVKFDDFYDNFASSKVYKIIKAVDDNDSSFIPTKIMTSQMPASKGGLFRILKEYENLTGEQIIKTPNYITPEILSIRNEFPEKFSLVLREKMCESYNNLFSESEKEEFYNVYMELLDIDDINLLRSKLINLMCYWGYDSLVNSLNLFTFDKSNENYKTFRISKSDSKESSIFASLFESVLKTILKTMKEFIYYFSNLEYPISNLGLNSDDIDLDSVPFTLAYSIYDFQTFNMNFSLSWCTFINCFMALLKDDDFVRRLSKEFSFISAISTLPISYENRSELIATINTLMLSWQQNNKLNEPSDLNPILKLQRLGDNVPNPAKVAKLFSEEIDVVKNTYHHGFLSQELYNELKRNLTFSLNEKKYNIVQQLTQLSETEVPVNTHYVFKRVLSEETLNDENWEDFSCELTTPDNEEEDITGFLEDVGMEITYEKSETIVKKKKAQFKEITAIIKWVPLLKGMGSTNITKRINQIGENVVIISDIYLPGIYMMRNGFVKMVDLNNFSNKKRIPKLLAHIICSKKLDKEFWDYYLPGEDFKPISEKLELLELRKIRDFDHEIKDFFDIGSKSIDLFKKHDDEEGKGEAETSENKTSLNESKEEEEEDPKGYDKAINYIKLAKERKEISENLAKELIEKYTKLKNDFLHLSNKPEKLDLKSLLKDMKIDTIMNLVNNDILFNLTKEQIRKVLQAPEHFGIAHGSSDPSERHIKDRHVKAELDSLEKDLMLLVSSGDLSMTKNMKNLCKSSFRLWSKHVKITDFKKEQKNFLLTLFLTIVSDSKVVTSDEHDDSWQRIINKVQLKIAEENDLEDEDEDEHKFRPVINPASRLFYRAVNR